MAISDSTTLDLQILGAAFGMADVTSNINSLVNRKTVPQSLSVEASAKVLWDGWRNVEKTLVVVYRYGENGLVKMAIAKENTTLKISGDGYKESQPYNNHPLSVLAAAYGPDDVTSKVDSLIDQSTQSLNFTPNNGTLGDSWHHVRKSFVIMVKFAKRIPLIFMDIVPQDQPYSIMYRPPLKILSAYYGLRDVLPVIKNAISRRAINIEAINNNFGDTWFEHLKTLSVVYQYGNQIPQLAVAVEFNSLKIDYDSTIGRYDMPMSPLILNVIRAVYGPKDVTGAVNAIKGTKNYLQFIANNDTFGDPFPGHCRTFSMTYSWGPLPPESLLVQENCAVFLSLPDYHVGHTDE